MKDIGLLLVKKSSRKTIAVIFLILLIPYLFLFKNNVFLLTKELIVSIFNIFIQNWYYSIIVILIPIISIGLLRKSTRIFNKKWEKHYPNIERWESQRIHPVKTKVIDDHQDESREIRLFNTGSETISNISGCIKFLYHDYQIAEIPFEVKNIEPNHGERIFYGKVKTKTKDKFNEFHTHLFSAKVGNNLLEDYTIYGTKFFITHHLILNEYNFFLFYEISWLKDKWKTTIKPWPQSKYSSPCRYKHIGYWNYYNQKPWLYLLKIEGEPWKYFWKRKLNQIKLLFVYASFFGIVVSFGFGAYNLTSETIIVTLDYFSELKILINGQ